MIVSNEGLAKLGGLMKSLLKTAVDDRQSLELQWLKNLRQYLGVYDPDIEARIPEDRSKAYPRDTRVKVKGGVAKLMEMMFPAQENNWDLDVSPNPSIPEKDLQAIIDRLTLQEQMQAQEEGRPVLPVRSNAIEREVRAFAEARKDKMQQEISDQLSDPKVDYPNMCKRVVRSGYIFGFGVVRGPQVRTQTERVWEFDKATGRYKAVEKQERRPYGEFVKVWDIYPDLSARVWWEQERLFERMVFHRHDFRKLAERSDFKGDVIRNYLKAKPSGNYIPKTFESDLRKLSKTENVANLTGRNYEVYRHLGFVSAHDLRTAGVEVKDSEMDQMLLADVWFIDDIVIKAEKAAFGDVPTDQYHAFVYAEDEDAGLTGVGLPEEIRDSQMCLCAGERAMMDNMAHSALPIREVNIDLLPPGRRSVGVIHGGMTIERTGNGAEAGVQCVRSIATESRTAEFLSIINMLRTQLDVESNLPAWTMGAAPQQLGDAFRTSNNMSMMTGGANMVTKDTVRAFDRFTSSFIGSLLRWNMEFNPKEEIKGDFAVRAKGNISLVAKEVRGAALDQFMQTVSPEERAMLDTYGVLLDRLRARDLPVDRVVPREEATQILSNMSRASAEAGQVEQGLTQAKTEKLSAEAEKRRLDTQVLAATAEATMQEILSRVEGNIARAKSDRDRAQLENLKTLLSEGLRTEPAQPAV
jgi:hypothetical protein